MPDPNRPRRLPPDPNPEADFEVVDDDAPAPKPAPRPAAKPPARPAPPAAARPAPKPPPKPAFEVVDDTEVEVSAKGKTAEVRKPARAARDDDEDDDRPRKKKPKKKKARTADDHEEDLRDRRLREFEIIWPTVLLVLGLGVSVTGAIGSAGATGILSVLVLLGGMVISVPLTIALLMVVGIVCGINYGRFGPAVLKIAAITLIVNGIYFIGEWFKIPFFLVSPVGCAVAFGLFKTQFDLDNQETSTSMGALNVLSFLMKLALLFLIVWMANRRERDSDTGNDPPPAESRRDRGKWKNQPAQPQVLNPGDQPDDPDDE